MFYVTPIFNIISSDSASSAVFPVISCSPNLKHFVANFFLNIAVTEAH